MPLITDPDDLTDGTPGAGTTEVEIDPANKTIKLNTVGNLSTDGVTMKALYSFSKEEWRNDPNGKILAAYRFPFTPITDESFELIEGWDFADQASRDLIRTAGWTVRDTSNNVTQMWAGVIGLGDIEADDQIYYDQGVGAVDAVLTGQINQAVQILSDPNGDGNYVDGFDYRGAFNLFVREQAQIFGSSDIGAIGVSVMGPIAYRFPLSTSVDLDVVVADTGIDSNSDGTADVAPYDNMSITYIDHANRGAYADATVYAANDVVQDVGDSQGNGADRWYITPGGGTSSGADLASDAGVTDWALFSGERQIGDEFYAFGVVIDGNGGTKQQIYEFVQWSLRQNVDIDAGAGSVIGETADALVTFVGPQLQTLQQSDGDGVVIDNFQAVDESSLLFRDDAGVSRTFPFNAVLTINFNDNLVNDASSRFWVFMTDPSGTAGDEWDTSGAVVLDDATTTDIGPIDVAANTSLQYTIAYDTNSQAGHTPGTDINITVVALGLETGQYVRATGTIQRSISNVVTLVAPLERNYENAA